MTTRTGQGGFNLDGKNYGFSRVNEGEPGDEPRPLDRGDFPPSQEKQDIGENVKLTIGQFLSSKTKVNKFPIDPTSERLSLTDENGNPVPASKTSGNRFSEEQARNFAPDGLRGDARALIDPTVGLNIKKGKASGDAPDGHELLPSVDPNDTTGPVAKYVTSVLSNNRFNAAALTMQGVFVDGVNTTTDEQRRVPQRPPENYNERYVHPRFGEVSARNLANVGSLLSLRSSAELGSGDRGADPTSAALQASALLPSANQLGLSRVELRKLEAADVIRDMTTEDIDENDLVSISPGGSWGNLNNVNDTFSGINSLGMIALSVAMASSVFLAYEGLASLIDLINVGPKALGRTTDGSYVMGRATMMPRNDPSAFPPDSMLDVSALLGIKQTVHPFKEALNAGTNAFFGIDPSSGILGQIGQAVTTASRSPGFNVVVARTIVRSGLFVVDKLKSIGGNPVSVVQDIITVVDEIRTSKLISIMNVFAALGDQLLTDDELDQTISEPGQPVKKSKIDSENDEAFARNVSKNRLKGGLKLAWASNRSPASYIVPDATMGMSVVPGVGAFNSGIGLQHDNARVFYKLLTLNDIQQRGARIPYDSADPNDVTVKSIENRLESEYVPFYLHDLRTNEIISFHAFITSLTDSFSPAYEESQGFGRVDPIKIYKSTTRKVSFSFYVASTSEEDFHDMWVKVNKLVTMVYPQYTKGRTLTTAEGSTITQPFSQLMSASPLVRLRIGDVIRSNYSRFALARLFGADSGTMAINGQPIKFEGLLNELKKKLQNALKEKNENYVWSAQTDNLYIPPAGGTTVRLPSVQLPGTSRSSNSVPEFRIDKHDLKFFEFRVVGRIDDRTVLVVPNTMAKQEIIRRFSLTSQDASNVTIAMKKKYDSAENAATRVVGVTYATNVENLVPSLSTVDLIKDQILSEGTDLGDSVQQLTDFLNPEKNVLVRAFQETRGKGLAGTIDQLDFDFFENVTWETAPGQRAPKFFRVNVSFTPIHDISPGIDHNGYNRAPVYPVGHFAHGSDDIKEGR